MSDPIVSYGLTALASFLLGGAAVKLDSWIAEWGRMQMEEKP